MALPVNATRKRLWTFLLVATAIFLSGEITFSQTIVIVSTDSLKATRRTISGAKSIVKAEYADAKIVPILIRTDAEHFSAQIDTIRSLDPDVLLTVSSAATRLAAENLGDLPIVFSSVLYPAISGFVDRPNRPGKGITGASLDIPVDIQFRYFRQIIPTMKRIGVLYTSNTATLIPPSTVVAAEMGLELVAIEVASPKSLRVAIDSMAISVDGIWSVADPNLFDPQSTKYILMQSMRRGVPFMGFSRHVVESGALFALDFDYKAIGRQAGQAVCEILTGRKPAEIPVTTPDIIWFHYNAKTAAHMKIEIPSQLVAIAREVYR